MKSTEANRKRTLGRADARLSPLAVHAPRLARPFIEMGVVVRQYPWGTTVLYGQTASEEPKP